MKRRQGWNLFYVSASLLLAFLFLTFVVSSSAIPLVDIDFSLAIQAQQHPHLDALMKGISWPGYRPQSILIPLSVSLAFLIFKKKREALFVALTLLSGVFSRVLKIMIDRPRPTENHVRILDTAQHQSFPSGHVLLYIAFFGFMIFLMNRLKNINTAVRLAVTAVSAFLILTIPISRIYLGAHWLTDVLGSLLLGILFLYGLSYLYLRKF